MTRKYAVSILVEFSSDVFGFQCIFFGRPKILNLNLGFMRDGTRMRENLVSRFAMKLKTDCVAEIVRETSHDFPTTQKTDSAKYNDSKLLRTSFIGPAVLQSQWDFGVHYYRRSKRQQPIDGPSRFQRNHARAEGCRGGLLESPTEPSSRQNGLLF